MHQPGVHGVRRWRLAFLAVAGVQVVRGGWGYGVLDLMGYVTGALVGLVMIGLWVGRRARGVA